MTLEPSRILAVSGSLRGASKNTALLEAMALLALPTLEVRLGDHIAALPHFNPDLEDALIPVLEAWRNAVRAADAVLISSPEYAHGIPGALKNALDWCVGSGEFNGKPVKLLNASSGGVHAQTQLREVLRTMDARMLEDARVVVPGAPQAAATIIANPEHAAALLEVLRSLEVETVDLLRKSISSERSKRSCRGERPLRSRAGTMPRDTAWATGNARDFIQHFRKRFISRPNAGAMTGSLPRRAAKLTSSTGVQSTLPSPHVQW